MAGAFMNETIAAIATPLQDGAISIIRISGEEAISYANAIFDKNLLHKEANTITYGYIINPETKEPVDEVLVSIFRSPKTFTKEDIVEINCHGGRFITKQVLQLVLAQGARLARAGEFTKRAFVNGRIDLAQAEAVMDIIEADNKATAKMALQGIKGSVRKLLEPLLQNIIDIIANIEVNIDYPEYDDVEQLTNDILLPKTNDWLVEITKILEKAESGKLLKEGIKTAIVGKPNVGKSSLLNALLEEEKAIVTDIEGTTRDIVEGDIHLQGITLHLIDTAGIRETHDVIEQIGIERSKQAIQEAQLVFVVLDGSKPLDDKDMELLELTKDKQRLLIYNKEDLMKEKSNQLTICAACGEIDALLQAIYQLYEKHLLVIEEPTLNNERQIGLMLAAKEAMLHAQSAMEHGVELDLIEVDIQEAYKNLKEILGEYHREDLLDTLFSNFCLGK